MYKLGARSLERLEGVHPDLVAVVKLAIQKTEIDFTVLEGLRTKERQVQLVASGASRTMNSRQLTGHAVELGAMLNGKVEWSWPLYDKIAKAMKEAADELNIPVEWGGDWKMKDGPHWQLPRYKYP